MPTDLDIAKAALVAKLREGQSPDYYSLLEKMDVPSAEVDARVPEFARPNQLGVFVKNIPGNVVRGATGTAAAAATIGRMLTDSLGMTDKADTPQIMQNIQGVQESGEQTADQITEFLGGREAVLSRPQGMPGQVLRGIGDFITENLPELVLTTASGGLGAGTLAAKAGAAAAKAGLRSTGMSLGRRALVTQLSSTLGRELGEGTLVTLAASVKNPAVLQNLQEMTVAHAQGNEAVADFHYKEAMGQITDEAVVNGLFTLAAVPAFAGLKAAYRYAGKVVGFRKNGLRGLADESTHVIAAENDKFRAKMKELGKELPPDGPQPPQLPDVADVVPGKIPGSSSLLIKHTETLKPVDPLRLEQVKLALKLRANLGERIDEMLDDGLEKLLGSRSDPGLIQDFDALHKTAARLKSDVDGYSQEMAGYGIADAEAGDVGQRLFDTIRRLDKIAGSPEVDYWLKRFNGEIPMSVSDESLLALVKATDKMNALDQVGQSDVLADVHNYVALLDASDALASLGTRPAIQRSKGLIAALQGLPPDANPSPALIDKLLKPDAPFIRGSLLRTAVDRIPAVKSAASAEELLRGAVASMTHSEIIAAMMHDQHGWAMLNKGFKGTNINSPAGFPAMIGKAFRQPKFLPLFPTQVRMDYYKMLLDKVEKLAPKNPKLKKWVEDIYVAASLEGALENPNIASLYSGRVPMPGAGGLHYWRGQYYRISSAAGTHTRALVHEFTHGLEGYTPEKVLQAFIKFYEETPALKNLFPAATNPSEAFAYIMEDFIHNMMASGRNILPLPPVVVNAMAAAGKQHIPLQVKTAGTAIADLFFSAFKAQKERASQYGWKMAELVDEHIDAMHKDVATILPRQEFDTAVEEIQKQVYMPITEGVLDQVTVRYPEYDDPKEMSAFLSGRLGAELDTFFSLVDSSDHELSRIYREHALQGNVKLVENMRKVRDNLALTTDLIGSMQDARGAAPFLENMRISLDQITSLNRGLREWNVPLFESRNTDLWNTSFRKFWGKAQEAIPILRSMKQFENKDISKFDMITSSAQWIGNKYPILRPALSALRTFTSDATRFSSELFDGTRIDMDFPTVDGVKAVPLGQLAELHGTNREAYDRVGQMLWASDQHASEITLGKLNSQAELAKHGVLRGDFGQMPRAWLEEKLGFAPTDEEYAHYLGALYTTNWIGRDMIKYLELKTAGTTGMVKEIEELRNNMHLLRGMVPHMRRGRFEMLVRDTDGKVVWYTRSDSRKELIALRDEFMKNGIAENGLSASQIKAPLLRKYKELPHDVYFGASPAHISRVLSNAMEMYKNRTGEAIGDEVRAALVDSLAASMKEGFILTHTKRRMNIGGFDKDFGWSLSQYVMNYSTAKARYGAMRRMVDAMQPLANKDYANAYKYLDTMASSVLGGELDFHKLFSGMRNVVIWRYLGANLSSAFMQLTQNPIMAAPRMSLEGIKRPNRKLFRAMQEVAAAKIGTVGKEDNWWNHSKFSPWEQQALYDGMTSGLTWANRTQAVMTKLDSSIGTRAKELMSKTMWFMQQAEELNRSSCLLASFRDIFGKLQNVEAARLGHALSREELMPVYQEAMKRATAIVDAAHLVYEKSNLPMPLQGKGAASSILRTGYQLKTFSHGYIQFMMDLARQGGPGHKAVLKSLATLIALGGAGAVPFVGGDSSDMPFPTSVNDALRRLAGTTLEDTLRGTLGDTGGRLVARGAAALLPWNVSTRMNPMAMDITPPVVGVVTDVKRSFDAWAVGDWSRALKYSPIMPYAVTRIPDALMRAKNGIITAGGKKIPNSESSLVEVLSSLVGFSADNEGYVRYLRDQLKTSHLAEEKSTYAKRIRNKVARGDSLDAEDFEEFVALKQKSAKLGRPWSYKSPGQIAMDTVAAVRD